MRRGRVRRSAVLAVSTLIVMVPAAIVFADSYRRDGQNRVIHHHTSAYTVYYGFTGGWKDQGENSRVEWNSDLDRLALGDHISLPRVDTPSDSVGADSQPEIDIEKQALGDTGALITWQAPYHDASSDVTINSSKSVDADEQRGRLCKVFGNVMGLAAAGSGRNDCMENPAVFKYVLDESVGLVNDFYGPNVSIDSPLTSRKDDVKTTGVYDVSATADGHATKSVTIRLDTNVIASRTQTPCEGNCSLSPNSPATVQNLSAGTHTLSATARNEFDQTTTKTITLTVAAPTPPWGFNEDWDRTQDPNLLGQIPRTGQGAAPTNLGATTNRLNVRWNEVESAAPVNGVHTYDWGNSVDAYHAMINAGQKPVLMLFAAPGWARVTGWESCPASIYPKGCAYPPAPAHDDDWQEFVHQAVIQFPDVLAIEVWNEPNLATFWYDPQPAAARYDQVLRAACLGAHQAGTPPPVITGGLSPGPGEAGQDPPAKRQQGAFLTNVYTAEAGYAACDDSGPSPNFRGIGEHVYPSGLTQGDWVDDQTATVKELRDVRSANTDGVARIWITEVGVSTGSDLGADGRTPTQQGPTLEALYEGVGSDVKSFLIHRYRDLSPLNQNTNIRFEHMGVVQSDASFTLKPAFGYLRCELGGRNCQN